MNKHSAPANPQSGLASVSDVAAKLNVSPRKVFDLVKRRTIPVVRIPGVRALRFDLSQIDSWLATGSEVGGGDNG